MANLLLRVRRESTRETCRLKREMLAGIGKQWRERKRQRENNREREAERERVRRGEGVLIIVYSIIFVLFEPIQAGCCCSNVAGRYHLVAHTIHLRAVPADPAHTVLHRCLCQSQDLHIHL